MDKHNAKHCAKKQVKQYINNTLNIILNNVLNNSLNNILNKALNTYISGPRRLTAGPGIIYNLGGASAHIAGWQHVRVMKP